MLPQVVLARTDKLYKAPPLTEFAAGDVVRVAHDASLIGGQAWQYGVVQWVHSRMLLNINYDGLNEWSERIPDFDVQRADAA